MSTNPSYTAVGKTAKYQGWGHRMGEGQIMPPFPYPGGKRNAAQAVWEAIGDVGGYIEPFAGSCAVLLGRPPFDGPRVETVNDADGMIVNALRSIKHSPEETAEHGFWPTSEADLHARQAWLAEWRTKSIPWLEGDPEAHDPRMAGWWLYAASLCIGKSPVPIGPWHVVDERLIRTERSDTGITRQIPHVGGTGRGFLRTQPESYGGTSRERVQTYFREISERLSRVRITAGDWKRPLAPSVLKLSVSPGGVGVFLDPPYEGTDPELYAVGFDPSIPHEVRDFCKKADPDIRIVLAGYDDDNDELLDLGWKKMESIGGQGSGFSSNGQNGRRERLWLSPSCIQSNRAITLF